MAFDLHNDFPTVISEADYEKYLSDRSGNIITAAIWTTEMRSAASETVERMTDRLAALRDPPPIAVEDIGFLHGADCDGFDFSRYFYCTLTWNYDNGFAGGALSDGALTDDGRKIIAAINGKCAVDLAHLNRKSFYAVLDVAERPMCSHTGFAAHPRCLNAAQIKALLNRRGVVGLSAVCDFTGAKTVRGLAEAIDKFVQSYGADGLCIGTDFNGTVNLPSGFADYNDFDTLEHELSRFGYTECDISKILYENAERFYEEVTNERHL